MSNLQLKNLKSGIKSGTQATLNLLSNEKTDFPLKLSLTNTQVSKLCKAFTNGPLANIKFSKPQLSKMFS